jgi:hypothetical protein
MDGALPVEQVDHRDLNRANNAWSNLRQATASQNQGNKRGWSSTGVKGVTRNKGKFIAYIKISDRNVCLGTYSTAEEAGSAYARAAVQKFGEFARV